MKMLNKIGSLFLVLLLLAASISADVVFDGFDTDGGRNYFKKGTVTTPNGVSKTDYCTLEPWGAHTANLIEYYLLDDGTRASYGFDCPNGCFDGACVLEVEEEPIVEPIYPNLCDIHDILDQGDTKTYEINNKLFEINVLFIDKNLAKFIVNGEVTDSLSEDDVFILADGSEISVYLISQNFDSFDSVGFCLNAKDVVVGKPDLVIQNLNFVFQYKCAPDTKCGGQLSTIDFDIVNIGTAPTDDWFAVAVYIDGKIYTHTVYNEQKIGTSYASDPDAVVPLMPGDFFHKSLSNYYWLNEGDHSITVVVDKLDSGDTQPNPIYDIYSDNMIDESNELNNKAEFWMKQAHFVDTDLAVYPLMFIKDNKLDALVVVGDTSPASDVVAAVDLINGITNLGSGVHRIDADAAVLDNTIKDLFSQNVILIGNTDFTKQLVGDFKSDLFPKLKPGMGYIRLLNLNGKYQLIVSGYDNEGTRKAARLLSNYKSHDIKGTQVLVDGTIENPFVIDIDSPDVPVIDVPINPTGVPVESDYLILKDFGVIRYQRVDLYDHAEQPFRLDDNPGIIDLAIYSHDVRIAVVHYDHKVSKKDFSGVLDRLSDTYDYYAEGDYYVLTSDDDMAAIWYYDNLIVVVGVFNHYQDDVITFTDTIDGDLADLVGAYQKKYPPMGKPPVVHPVMPVNPVISIPTPVNPPIVVPNNGCVINGVVVPISFRTDDQFCSINRDMVNQLSGGLPANNNFQCRSNLAIDGFCVEQGFFQRIISWFVRVFNF